MPYLNENIHSLSEEGKAELVTEATLNVLETLPEEFVHWSNESSVIIKLSHAWLEEQAEQKLSHLLLMLYFLHVGGLWNNQEDPLDTIYIKELSKLNAMLKNGNIRRSCYNILPKPLLTLSGLTKFFLGLK